MKFSIIIYIYIYIYEKNSIAIGRRVLNMIGAVFIFLCTLYRLINDPGLF